MDHSMMSSMAGMGMDMSDMGSSSVFRHHNQSLARTYWYLIAACSILAALGRIMTAIDLWSKKRICRTLSVSHPTRPRNVLSQAYATTIAIFRETTYPPVYHISHSFFEWLSPPPLGQSLAIVTYWVIITLFLTAGSIVHDAYYWERVAFRAAWISVTQVPLIYLLAGKVNVLGLVFGSSYIDPNWIHRWVSRTLLVTATVHGAFFIAEWVRADFFQAELDLMPMVRWGLAAWGILAWTAVSSLFPLRRLCYELFVIQHIASAAVFLWVLYKHVPRYAAYNVWMAVAFAVSGRVLRICIFLFRNLSKNGMGYVAELEAKPGDITKVTVRDVGFTWKPGQHTILWCPTLGPLGSHPFTIANIPQKDCSGDGNQLQLVIRARSGFTRKLYQRATSNQNTRPSKTRAFITGPFGNLPTWNAFETVVLISASTGASFTLPILESILNDPCCVSRIDCLFLVRQREHIDAYLQRLIVATSHPRAVEVELQITIAITGEKDTTNIEANGAMELKSLSSSSTSSEGASNALLTTPDANPGTKSNSLFKEKDAENISIHSTTSLLTYTHGRPSLSSHIRTPIEASAGETLVVVCGGKSLTSDVRSIVARLSDERAVHKGTGAQGIRLWCEGFGS